jgi:hypothetical protein
LYSLLQKTAATSLGLNCSSMVDGVKFKEYLSGASMSFLLKILWVQSK